MLACRYKVGLSSISSTINMIVLLKCTQSQGVYRTCCYKHVKLSSCQTCMLHKNMAQGMLHKISVFSLPWDEAKIGSKCIIIIR